MNLICKFIKSEQAGDPVNVPSRHRGVGALPVARWGGWTLYRLPQHACPVQLVHAATGASLLVPCEATAFEFELWPIRGGVLPLASLDEVETVLYGEHGAPPPPAQLVAVALRWFVHARLRARGARSRLARDDGPCAPVIELYRAEPAE